MNKAIVTILAMLFAAVAAYSAEVQVIGPGFDGEYHTVQLDDFSCRSLAKLNFEVDYQGMVYFGYFADTDNLFNKKDTGDVWVNIYPTVKEIQKIHDFKWREKELRNLPPL